MDPFLPTDAATLHTRAAADRTPGAPVTPGGGSFQPSRLTIEQLRELRDVWLTVAEAAEPSAAQVMVTRIGDIIQAPAGLAVIGPDGEPLVEAASSPEIRTVVATDELRYASRDLAPGGRPSIVPVGEGDQRRPWTCVPIGSGPVRVRFLVLPGDWSRWPSLDWTERFARDLAAALQLPDGRSRLRRRARLLTHARAFSRELARIAEPEAAGRAVVEAFARAARAEQVALALYDEDDGHLRIAATYGYPLVLVEHVRIAPGAGVIGQVFSSHRALRVSDVGRLAALHPRPRYRTPSFMALPLMVGGAPLGVVTLADRSDGRPFDRADLVAASTLAAPAGLALGRQMMVQRASELAHAIAIEPLTGLFNRRHFSTRIEEEVERARRYLLDLALLLIDIDDFKRLNDTRGHLVGDAVLRDTAGILRQSVRVFDVCTRFGGDEFAILMPGSSAASAMQSADRIRQRVEAYRLPPEPGLFDDRLTISIGVAARKPTASAEEMIAAADRALYAAKAEGKNRVKILD